jgi:putative DNA primase/helicase
MSNVVQLVTPATAKLARATPHKTAEKFLATRPTLLRYGEDWIEYTGSAYEMVADEIIESDVTKWLIKAVVVGLKTSKEDPTVTVESAEPFNPKPADVNQVVTTLIRLCQVKRTAFEPPCFRTDRGDLGALALVDPRKLIACQNCLVDMTTGRRFPKTDAFLTFFALPVNYDPDAECPRWLQFLGEVFPHDAGLQRLMQQWYGLLISDDMRFQRILYMRGRPRSGKGTAMRVLDELIGENNIMNHSLRDLAERSGREALLGKSLLKVTDMNAGSELPEACSIMLQISGQDPTYIFRKHKTALNVRLRCRIAVAGNPHPLDFGHNAAAMGTRLSLLPFNETFLGKEDRNLDATLKAELAGILNWAIEGYADLLREGGLIEPPASVEAKRSLLYSGNTIWGFVQERCVLDPQGVCDKDDLFSHFEQFCYSINATPGLKNKFADKLMNAFGSVTAARPRDDEGGRLHVFKGIRLRDSQHIWFGVPTITFRLDPFLLDLGFKRTDPKAILRLEGKPVLYEGATDFDDDDPCWR